MGHHEAVPVEHVLKHGEEGAGDRTLETRVAFSTAVIAVIMAMATLGANHSGKEMLLAQQQASDQWAFYQAKNLREHTYRLRVEDLKLLLAERGAAMPPKVREAYGERIAAYGKQADRYGEEKKEIMAEAKKLEAERDHARRRTIAFDYAEVVFQIAIVLGSLAILSSSRPIFFACLAMGGLAALLTLNGYLPLVSLP